LSCRANYRMQRGHCKQR